MKFLFAATLLLIAVFGSEEKPQEQKSSCPVEMQLVVEAQANLKKELVENLKTVQNKIEERVCEVNNKQCEDLKTEEAKEIADVITEIVAEKIPTAQELCEQQAKTEEFFELIGEAMQTKDEDKLKEIEEKSEQLILDITDMTQEELEQAKEEQKAMEKQMNEMMENIEPIMELVIGNLMTMMMNDRVDVGTIPIVTEEGSEDRLLNLVESF